MDMVTHIVSCPLREVRRTEGCGGALYWWCNEDNKQVNPYEVCKGCER